MPRPTAKNKRAPGGDTPRAQAPTAGDACVSNKKTCPSNAPRQSELFDVASYIPTPTASEREEVLRRAVIFRDFLTKYGRGTVEEALADAGGPVEAPAGMRGNAVNPNVAKVAMRRGWAIPSGGVCRAKKSKAAHAGRIGHYLAPEGQP